MVVHSATLEINETVQARRARGDSVLHLGFGEAGLPVLPEIAEALRRSADLNSYGPVTGSAPARSSVAGHLTRRRIPTEPTQVLLAPGSKALLFALLTALPGDVVLPTPSWVTYAAQAGMTGKGVLPVPTPADTGGIPDPEILESTLATVRADGATPGILILTLPDNPTGTTADTQQLRRVCACAQRHGLTVVSDEIYRDLAEHPDALVSPATLLDDRVVVTGGLSKSLALGGWRVGFARLPDTDWGRTLMNQLVGIASEVWSSLAAPIQQAARFVFDDPNVVTDRITASRHLHLSVSRALHQVFVDAGAHCRTPTAAFYLYPDLEPWRDNLAEHGATTGAAVARYLLDHHGIAVLPGDAFGDYPTALRFRVATSLLYGNHQQQLSALGSDDPANLPWIAEALDTISTTLRTLK